MPAHRSAGQDAGDAHPHGAGHRRIRRHRRPGLDRGHGREVVGDIEDEHDEDDTPAIVRQPDGSFLADARAQLEDVVAAIGPEFDIGDIADEVDTLGGYVVTLAGRVPVARRDRAGAGRLRVRGARRRSAPGQAGPHLPQQEPRDGEPRCTPARRQRRAVAARASPPSHRPTRDRRDRTDRVSSRGRRTRSCSPGAGGAPRSRSRPARVSALALPPFDRLAGVVRHVSGRWSG